MREGRVARCRDRAAQWQSGMHRAATQLMAACPDDADAIVEHLERELVAGPDFTRCHRGSEFRAPPKVNTDRNFLARLMFMADMIERKSWAVKAKGKHGGTIGKAALRLLRTLLYVVNKREGHLSPTYDTLARLAQMSRRAVVTAMQVLATMGFVTIHRRIKRVRTPFGIKVVQDSNAYEYHMPKGIGALAWSIFRPTSECNKFTARTITIDDSTSSMQRLANAERPQSGRPRKEAIAFATELASIAGHRLDRLPQSWIDTNPAQVVQTWINSLIDAGSTLRGDPIAMLRLIAQDVIRRKPDPQPPRSPRYFAPTIREVVEKHIRARSMPVPLPKVAA